MIHVVECGPPPALTNGESVISGPVTPSGTPVLGAMATYNCSEGFNLVGVNVLECQPDGSWLPVSPGTCEGENVFYIVHTGQRFFPCKENILLNYSAMQHQIVLAGLIHGTLNT